MTDETDIELKKIQLELAKVDLEAKRLDLSKRPGPLSNALSNPVVVAAAIAALVTVSTGVMSYVVSGHQKQIETQKAVADQHLQQLKAESDMILQVVKTNNPDQAATNLQFLVDAGLVPLTELKLVQYLGSRLPHTGKFLPIPDGQSAPINPPPPR
jgi:hypothetical protein